MATFSDLTGRLMRRIAEYEGMEPLVLVDAMREMLEDLG
jgi:hypothetical protein